MDDKGEAPMAKLNCCDHAFCYPCIKEWTDRESQTSKKCPVCQKNIETISRKMKSGQEVIHQVEEAKESDFEEEEITFIPCVVCNRDTD